MKKLRLMSALERLQKQLVVGNKPMKIEVGKKMKTSPILKEPLTEADVKRIKKEIASLTAHIAKL